MLSVTFCEALADGGIVVLSLALGALSLIGLWVVIEIIQEELRRG